MLHDGQKERALPVARPPWAWWWSIAASALALRLYVAPLEFIGDECVYIQHAWNVARGHLDLSDSSWYVHRIPVYLPTGLLYWVAGFGHASTLVWPLLASLVQLLLAMVLALRISGRAASILTGVLLAFLPLDVVSSVHLMPDILLGSLMSASVVCWWLGGESSRRDRGLFLFTCSGMLLALAVLVRPYAIILSLFFLADLGLGRQSIRNLLIVAVGGGIVALAYLVTYELAVGHPLYRWGVVTGTYSGAALAEPARLLYYPRVLLDGRELLGLHGLAFLGGLLTLLRRRNRAELRLLAWLVLIALFLEFGSMSLETYVPILKRNRYLTPLSLPLCVFLGVVMVRGISAKRPQGRMAALVVGPRVAKGLTAVALALLFATSVVQLQKRIQTERPRHQAYAAVSTIALDRPDLPVLVDHWRTAVHLGPHVSFFDGAGFYFGHGDEERMGRGAFDPGGRLAYLDPATSLSQFPSGLILIDRHDPHEWKDRVRQWLGLCDDCNGSTTVDLRLLFEGSGLELYEFTHQGGGSPSGR